ncbi:HEAT repeat protein [bacterium BMS3Abin01]|nr:HEAT repeat protein [bacterium BMS3Abin01]
MGARAESPFTYQLIEVKLIGCRYPSMETFSTIDTMNRSAIRTLPITLVLLVLLLAALALIAPGCGQEADSSSRFDVLITRLGSGDEGERQAASAELVQAGEPAVEPLIAALYGDVQTLELLAAVKDTLTQIGEPAVEPLVSSLSYSGERRATALAWKKNILVAIGEPAVGPLTRALSDENATVRGAAVEMLGKLGAAGSVDAIAALLDDPDDEVRERAAETLEVIADPRGIVPLTAALDDEKRAVRQAVRNALVSIHAAVGVDPQLQSAFDTCVAVEVLSVTDPYGLVVDSQGNMINPEVLWGLSDDEKIYILSMLNDCIRIIR